MPQTSLLWCPQFQINPLEECYSSVLFTLGKGVNMAADTIIRLLWAHFLILSVMWPDATGNKDNNNYKEQLRIG